MSDNVSYGLAEGGITEPDKSAVIASALEELDDHIERVQNRLNTLEIRLGPVMTPEEEVAEKMGAVSSSTINESPISKRLRSILYRVADMRRQLDYIQARIEL